MEQVVSASRGQIGLGHVGVCREMICDIANGSVNRSSSACCHIRKCGYSGCDTWQQHGINSQNTQECSSNAVLQRNLILFFWICGYNTLNKFNEGNWVFADVQGEISLVTSFWRSSFERVWKLLAYSPGATWPACSVNSPWAADWRSTSLVVSATEQGLKLANTHCVNSCIWDLKLLDCHTGNVVHFLVAFLRQVVDNTWEAVRAKNAAQE